MSMRDDAAGGNDGLHIDSADYVGPVTWVDISRIYELTTRVSGTETPEADDEPKVDPNGIVAELWLGRIHIVNPWR